MSPPLMASASDQITWRGVKYTKMPKNAKSATKVSMALFRIFPQKE